VLGILGYSCTIHADDPELLRRVVALYGPCLVEGSSDHVIELRTERARGTLALEVDGEVVMSGAGAEIAIARLVWEVNQGVLSAASGHLLVHAAAAERDGAAVVIPGASGAGKSLLVTGLVRAGLRYLTDETVAIDRTQITVASYPKPVSLVRDDERVLAGTGTTAVEPGPGEPWLLAPSEIRRQAVAPSGARPALVVHPAYRPGAPARLHRLSRAAAAGVLAKHSFNFATTPGALHVVAEVVRGCECYRLEMGDLDRACDLVIDALDASVARGGRRHG
jgi:hypothetical protein